MNQSEQTKQWRQEIERRFLNAQDEYSKWIVLQEIIQRVETLEELRILEKE
jgi:hypothetical protein